jgi:ATP-dependent helicase/nuclease subunit A
MSFEPTPPQRVAIESIYQDTVVTAGAGSGKTRVLVERYINLLRSGFTIDQIAAITFTKKAAQEMKDRIRRELPHMADLIESAQISTIHSLCQRIILEHPREAGIDPRCRVAEEWEADALLYRVITDLVKDVELEEEYRSTSDAVDLLHYAYKQMIQRGETSFRREYSAPDVDEAAGRLCAVVDGFLQKTAGQRLTERQRDIILYLRARWPQIKVDLLSGDGVFIEDGIEALADMLSGTWGKLKADVDEVKSAAADVNLALKEAHASRVLEQLGDLLAKVHHAYSQTKRNMGLLDFGDLELLAARLLQNPEVVQSYDFRQIMVDEFQDTNPLQKQIVDRLCRGGAKLFIVGDPKQSIYRFRGADVKVFTQARAEISAAGQPVVLDKNFRSRPELIRFTNAFFAALMQEDPIGYERSEPDREPVGKPLVHLIEVNAEGASMEEGRHLEAERIAWQIRELVDSGRYAYKDITLLFRTRTYMRIYERALQAARVPYVNLSGRGFYSRQEVQDILNYFAWLDDSEDHVAKLAVLRSPFYSVSDDGLYWEQRGERCAMTPVDRAAVEKALADREALVEFVRSRPAPYVMQEMLERTDYISTTSRLPFGEQKAANVQKLLQQSWDLYTRGYVSCADQLHYIAAVRRRSDEESEAQLDAEYADVVVVRTVHNAKGLEFPVVFVPDTSGRLTKNSGAQVVYHPTAGLAYNGTAAYEQAKELNRAEELSEARRLLYVAVTRAKEELYLCGITGPEQSDSWWNWIKQTTAFVPSDLYDYASPEPAVLVPELQAAQVETAAAREITGTPAPSYSHVALSVTALMVYARCPRCYYLRYILGIPEQIRGLTAGGSVKASSSRLTGLERGNIVHRVCERITDPSQLDDLIELAAALEGVRLSPAQTRDLKNIVQPYLESQFFQRLKQGDVEIHREYNFAVPLGTKFVLNGTVDQVFLGSEGLEIVDFKSNWVSPEQVAEEGEKYRWQLRAYAWAMAKLFARPVVQSQAYFLIPNRVFALTEADLNLTAAEADLMAACEGIIAGERHGLAAFPRDPHCSDCLRWEE